jgi:hypothetical protein
MPTLVAVSNAYASLPTTDSHLVIAVAIVVVFGLVMFVNLLRSNA